MKSKQRRYNSVEKVRIGRADRQYKDQLLILGPNVIHRPNSIIIPRDDTGYIYVTKEGHLVEREKPPELIPSYDFQTRKTKPYETRASYFMKKHAAFVDSTGDHTMAGIVQRIADKRDIFLEKYTQIFAHKRDKSNPRLAEAKEILAHLEHPRNNRDKRKFIRKGNTVLNAVDKEDLNFQEELEKIDQYTY